MTELRFWDGGAILEAPPKERRWLVEPFAPSGGILLLHGPSGIGKSHLALTLSIAVARGEPFLVPEYRTTRGPTLYFQLDMSEDLVRQRLERLPRELAASVAFATTDEGAINCLDPLFIPARVGALRQAQDYNPALVVVDALRDTHFLDEIDSQAAAHVFSAWRKLFPAATLAFIHHDRKIPAGIPLSEQASNEAARGSGAWLAKANAALHLTRAKGGLLLTFSKVRACPPQPPRTVRINPDSLLIELVGATGEQTLARFLVEHPGASESDARRHLLQAGYSKSYVSEMLKKEFAK